MWAFAANDSVEEGLRLRADAEFGTSAGRSVHTLVTRLQDERRLTAAWQDRRTTKTYTALKEARSRTDAAVKEFHASEAKLKRAGAGAERSVAQELNQLTKQRNQIDLHAATRKSAYGYYTGVTTAGTTLLADVLHSDDGELARSASAVTSLVHIAELLSREDALLAGAQSSGRMSSAFRQAFLGHVASQRHVAGTLNTRDMPNSAADSYARITDLPQWAVVQKIENAVDADTNRNTPQSSTQNIAWRKVWIDRATTWRPAAEVVGRDLRDAATDSLDGIAEKGNERADDAQLTAVAGSAAVLAVLALTTLLAVRSTRSLSRRISQLNDATAQWTDRALPDLAERYKQGDLTATVSEAPHEDGRNDELGRLVEAVREQQRTAVEELGGLAKAIDDRWKAAAQTSEQKARKRDGAETVVLGLLRRNQLLISQLITLIDGLERREHDPELLTEIFKVDHLVTRLRRDLENQSLIVGVQPGRRWSKPVPVFQVLRSAVAETVDYTRVEVETAPEFSLSGRVVADVGHILAALIENGTAFSPPHTNVNVRAEEVAEGRLVVEVIDRGLGMDAEQYAHLNQLLADPPEPDVTRLGEIPQLGLFVVALLANRIGLEITLCRSAYGGTKAVVLIPSDLLEEAPPMPQRATGAVREHRPVDPGERLNGDRTERPAPVPVPERRTPAPRPEPEPAPAPAPAAATAAPAKETRPAPEPEWEPEDELGGYPAYTGGGLLTRSRVHTAAEAPVLAGLIPQSPDPEPRREPEPEPEPVAEAAAPPRPAAGEVPQKSPEPAQKIMTLPTRKPGANLAAPLRRSAEQSSAADEDHEESTSPWPTPDRAAGIAGAVQRAGRQARTESSDAQRNGAAPGTPESDGATEVF